MFVLTNFLVALAKVIELALDIYMWIIIFRAVISWVNPDPYNQLVVFLYRVTEPVLRPIRRIMPVPIRETGIDFSPVLVILLILFLKYFLVDTIIQLAGRL